MKKELLKPNGELAIVSHNAHVFFRPEPLQKFIKNLYAKYPTTKERESFFLDNFDDYAFSTFYHNYRDGRITHDKAVKLATYLNVPVSDIEGDIIPRAKYSHKKSSDDIKNKPGKRRGRPPKKLVDDGQISLDFNPVGKSVVAPGTDQDDHDDIDALIVSTSEHLKAGVDLGIRWLKVILKQKGLH